MSIPTARSGRRIVDRLVLGTVGSGLDPASGGDDHRVSRGAVSDQELIAVARRQTTLAYAPYSKFRSGAAVVTDTGEVVTGAIVENVSLGLAMCAERVAMFTAVAAGRRPTRLALAAPETDGSRTWPCGACLQVALELGGRDLVVLAADTGAGPVASATIDALLPRGPKKSA
jgi:cytidine deaminase